MIIDHDDGGNVDDEDEDDSAGGDVCAVLRVWCTALVAELQNVMDMTDISI